MDLCCIRKNHILWKKIIQCEIKTKIVNLKVYRRTEREEYTKTNQILEKPVNVQKGIVLLPGDWMMPSIGFTVGRPANSLVLSHLIEYIQKHSQAEFMTIGKAVRLVSGKKGAVCHDKTVSDCS